MNNKEEKEPQNKPSDTRSDEGIPLKKEVQK
ncbi:hypothetical protein Dip510_001618 [Elusimicrobium posterum]